MGENKVGRRTFSRVLASVAAAALLLTGLTVAGPQTPAVADSAPSDPATPTTVAADGLPTAQIDGVAWSQVIVGRVVYVAGEFTTARPAGAAPGTGTVARSNLMAYNLDTGELLPWAPVLDGPAYVIKASLSGTQLYVGGDFRHVNGAAHDRFVALDPTSGTRITTFNPRPNGAVRAIASTASTIYLGGAFTTMAGNSRPRLAAISSTTGALLEWRATAQSTQVEALLMSPDNSRLIVSGRFEFLNGVPAVGSGALSPVDGSTLRWDANALLKNSGFNAGITSLSTDGTLIYGTGFAFISAGGVGNLEGTFAADPSTGAVVWVEDCHGDTYSVYANPGKDHVYIAGHPYFCGNMGDFPEGSPRLSKFALAFSKRDVTTITPDWHNGYFNWQGNRAPELLNFYPEFAVGTYTGQAQAGWTVTGSGDYVVYGGEFLSVNGQPQQGLVRMAMSGSSTNLRGPRLSGTALQPAATSTAAGTAQVSWPTNWDQDNETLTYTVQRDDAATPVYTAAAKSTFWRLPRLSFADTGLTAGQAYSYKVTATDPFGNAVTSPSVSVTVAAGTAAALSPYAGEVLGDSPAAYWRLGDATGSAADWTGYAASTFGSNVTRGVAGAIGGDTDAAARFTGVSSSRVYGTRSSANTNRFSVEAWFRTTSTSGGKIVGFGDSSTGTSANYDRHVYMGTDGTLNFGVNPESVRVVSSPQPYNDGQWHHVVATLGTTGMRLYVDGALSAERTDTISALTRAGSRNLTGYWRIGGDAIGTWPGAGEENFVGDIDEVAVYGRTLTSTEVGSHHTIGATGAATNHAPTARFVATGADLSATFDGTASTDSDGTVASYAWTFGDGGTGAGATASHAYAAAGTYTVTLTAADDAGASDLASHRVVVTDANALPPPNVIPVASFTSRATGLSAALDATASSDSDGTIASYAWTFGDGATGEGMTPSHAYAVSGNYPVRLTVTDDDGATAFSQRNVRVTAFPAGVVASDVFDRILTPGFGTAGLGGAWSASATSTSVADGVGRFALATKSSISQARLPDAAGTNVRTQVTERWDKRPNGAGGTLLLRGRITAGGEYRLRVGHKVTGGVSARIVRTTAAGVETAITPEINVGGVTYTSTTVVAAQLQVTGTSPTTLRAKVWTANLAQPATWLIETTDATAALQGPGHTGVAALLSGSVTNGPVNVLVDNYTVTDLDLVPVPPAPPVAAFTVTTAGLVVGVDATTSTDSDGAIASYTWDFGDGGTGSGVTASHTFAVAGTYQITLTLTDDDGDTSSTVQPVTVPQASGVRAVDAFERTVAAGFGSADLGGAWTATAGATSVSAGTGVFSLATQSALAGARLAGVSGTSLRTQVTQSWDKRPNGSGGAFLVRGRITTVGEYRLRVGHKSTGAVTARIVRTTSAGAETAITPEITVSGVTYTTGTAISAQFEVTGTSPTTLRAKVWTANQPEPAAWLINTTDATVALQATGHTGFAALLSSTVTNRPVAVRVDNYSVTTVG